MSRRSVYLSVLMLSAIPMTAGIAADADPNELKPLDGEALYREKSCVICHGERGLHPTLIMYPKLAGQNKAYLIAQTKAIQTAERTNGFTKVMMPFMGITDAEIHAIAEYLARQK